MRKTGENYFNEYNLTDLTVLSDYGIDEAEQNQIEKASKIEALEYIYLTMKMKLQLVMYIKIDTVLEIQ